MIRRFAILGAALALPVAVSGCESTQDKAAKIQKENARKQKLASMPLTIPKSDPKMKVTETVVLRSKDLNAVVVSIKNTGNKPIADIPIAVSVVNSAGKEVGSNTAPGTDHWLNHVPLIRPGQTFTWVNDQFDPTPSARKARVKVGIGTQVAKPYPDGKLVKPHFFQDPATGTAYTGKVKGNAPVLQMRVVIFSVGRQGGRIVTAGRGVLEKLLPNGGKPQGFTIFYVGANPKTASLTNEIPPVLSPKSAATQETRNAQ